MFSSLSKEDSKRVGYFELLPVGYFIILPGLKGFLRRLGGGMLLAILFTGRTGAGAAVDVAVAVCSINKPSTFSGSSPAMSSSATL